MRRNGGSKRRWQLAEDFLHVFKAAIKQCDQTIHFFRGLVCFSVAGAHLCTPHQQDPCQLQKIPVYR
jgi:hypothetical protein